MTIQVRAEVTTTEFDEGAVFDVESSERTDALLSAGYLTKVESDDAPAEKTDTADADAVVDTSSGMTGETIDTDTDSAKKPRRGGATT